MEFSKQKSQVGSENEREGLLQSTKATSSRTIYIAVVLIFCLFGLFSPLLRTSTRNNDLVLLGQQRNSNKLFSPLLRTSTRNNDLVLLGQQRNSKLTYGDVLDTRKLLVPTNSGEQMRSPVHVYAWDGKTGNAWTIQENGKALNVDDRSTGVVQFLGALMPLEFADISKPIHFAWTTQDYPENECIDQDTGCEYFKAPIFTFGSIPKDTTKMPNLIQGPTLPFVTCMAHAYDPNKFSDQCDWYSTPFQCTGDNMFTGSSVQYDSLTPKMFWRGSDWPYLEAYDSQGTRSGSAFLFNNHLCDASREVIVNAVLNSGNNEDKLMDERVSPRLRAVIRGRLNPNDYDIKFSDSNEHAPGSFCIDSQMPDTFESNNTKTACDVANYKWLLDIGGGGGTSWKSTFWFLGMPGVLFHHETPMKDSFYDMIKPWIHYIPLNNDLSDLDERLNWAKANPAECAAISKRANEFVSWMMTPIGLKEHAYFTFVKPLKKFIKQYGTSEDNSMDVREMTLRYSNGDLVAWEYDPQELPYLGVRDSSW